MFKKFDDLKSYKSPNKFIKHSLYFDFVRSLNTKHLDDTFVLYSTCQTIKDYLIGYLLYFLYK